MPVTPPTPRDQGNAHSQAGDAVRGGWGEAGGFFGSVMGGFLLGFGADWLFGTEPLFVVIGIVVGSIGGFYKMMAWAKSQEEKDRRERYAR
jgi:F0F1-type ATP synthase assembly protein I